MKNIRISEIDMNSRLRSVLLKNKINTLNDLLKCEDFNKIKGLGDKLISELEETIREYGYIFVEKKEENGSRLVCEKTFTYDDIKEYLDLNYKSNTDKLNNEELTIFKDETNRIVAVCRDDVITLYFACDPSKISHNHNGKVMVGIIKNMPLVKYNRGSYCDVMLYDGMCGSITDFKKNNLFVKEASMPSFIDSYNLGSIGSYTEGIFIIGDNDVILKHIPRFDPNCNFKYGILSKKRKCEISEKKYDEAYKELNKDYSWFFKEGYRATGSDITRKQITKLAWGNYHYVTNNTFIEFSDKAIEQIKNKESIKKTDEKSEELPVETNENLYKKQEELPIETKVNLYNEIDETSIKKIKESNEELDKMIAERKRKLELLKEYTELVKQHNEKLEELKQLEIKIRDGKNFAMVLKDENKQ